MNALNKFQRLQLPSLTALKTVILPALFVLLLLVAQPALAQECNQSCNKDDVDGNDYLDCIKEKKSCLEDRLDEVREEKKTLTNTISIVNGRISIQELQISQLQEEIVILEREIGELDQRISGLNISLDRLSVMLIDRIKEQYKQTRASPVFLLFSSDSVNQFVTQFKYLQLTGDQTANAMERAETQRVEYDEQKTLKEIKQAAVVEKSDQLELEKAELDRQKAVQQFLLAETQNNETKYQAELAKTLAELQAIQSIIAGKGDESEVREVEEGESIADIIVGASACSNGTHLHFEVVENGRNYDPAAYLKSIDAVWNNGGADGPFGFGGDWNWPLDNPAKINQGYGMTSYAEAGYYNGYPHTGIDMASKSSGDYTVRAVRDGTLYRGSIACGGGLLRYVKVEHEDDDYETYYLHVNY